MSHMTTPENLAVEAKRWRATARPVSTWSTRAARQGSGQVLLQAGAAFNPVPRKIVTDKLRSYAAAKADIPPSLFLCCISAVEFDIFREVDPLCLWGHLFDSVGLDCGPVWFSLLSQRHMICRDDTNPVCDG